MSHGMIFLEFSKGRRGWRISRKFISVLVKTILKSMKFPRENRYHLSVGFVEPQEIRRVNRDFRGKNRVTDVISIGSVSDDSFPKKEIIDFGEILICYAQAAKQAKEHGLRLHDEIRKLFLHGFLHNLGYDHEKEEDAREMEGRERKIFSIL
jgi:probable rRNA maturation factor